MLLLMLLLQLRRGGGGNFVAMELLQRVFWPTKAPGAKACVLVVHTATIKSLTRPLRADTRLAMVKDTDTRA
jgi:hypothetical protein